MVSVLNQETILTDNALLTKDQHSQYEALESRFGTIQVNRKNTVNFPYGIAGIPDGKSYTIAELPQDYQQRLPGFRVLQSMEDTNLSFIVLPLGVDNILLDKKDLQEGCHAMEIDPKNLMVLLITSVHRSIDPNADSKLSVNTKAPILVDAQNKVAAQYIFLNESYEIRHMLGTS